MKIIYGDVFVEMKKFDAVGVPTNGQTNGFGLAIMGAGVAKAAVQTFGPWIREFLGAKIDRNGNHVHVIEALSKDGNRCREPGHIFSFPTKVHWSEKSALWLIEQSATELVDVIQARGWQRVCMPEPGTGLGGLSWDEVRPILAARFGDELTIVRLPNR